MDKYIKSYLFTGCLGMIVFGLGVLFTDFIQMPVKTLIAICMILWGGAGLFLMLKTDKLNFSSLASEKMSFGMVLRSGIAAFGAVYAAYMTYNILGLNNPITLMIMAVALGSVVLLPYHYNLYAKQKDSD